MLCNSACSASFIFCFVSSRRRIKPTKAGLSGAVASICLCNFESSSFNAATLPACAVISSFAPLDLSPNPFILSPDPATSLPVFSISLFAVEISCAKPGILPARSDVNCSKSCCFIVVSLMPPPILKASLKDAAVASYSSFNSPRRSRSELMTGKGKSCFMACCIRNSCSTTCPVIPSNAVCFFRSATPRIILSVSSFCISFNCVSEAFSRSNPFKYSGLTAISASIAFLRASLLSISNFRTLIFCRTASTSFALSFAISPCASASVRAAFSDALALSSYASNALTIAYTPAITARNGNAACAAERAFVAVVCNAVATVARPVAVVSSPKFCATVPKSGTADAMPCLFR